MPPAARRAVAASLICAFASAAPGARAQEDPGLRATVESYAADADALRDFYDGPNSHERTARMKAFLEAERAALAGVATPATAAAIDRHLLEAELTYRAQLLDREAARDAKLARLLPFADAVRSLVVDADNGRRRFDEDPKAAADMLAQIAELAELARPIPENERPSPADAVRAAERVVSLRNALGDWFRQFEPFDPVFGWWAREPFAAADRELAAYARYLYADVAKVKNLPQSLRERRGGEGEETDPADDPLIGDPIGREALLQDLAHEMIPYTPEQLIAIARRELAWCREQQVAAAREMGLGDDWKQATEQMKSDFVGPGQQDELVRRQAVEAIAFLDDRGLVTIPDLCRETWRLTMTPPRQQRVLPFAAYGGQRMLVGYAADEFDHNRKVESMRGNATALSRIVVPHELIPGHHLQRFASDRSRPYRRPFSTPFYVEGWALHWEMLLWDLEYPRTPEERLGMLLWRSHRSARIFVSLGFHLGRMSPEQMIDFLVDEIGLERDGATAEVRRYIGDSYSPLYQCAYLIGGLQIRALHKELVGGGTMTHRQFHDAVLAEHSIPIAMVRAALLELDPEQVAEPWYFEGDVEPDALDDFPAAPTTQPSTRPAG